jgi:hypothetical protein
MPRDAPHVKSTLLEADISGFNDNLYFAVVAQASEEDELSLPWEYLVLTDGDQTE